MKSVYQLFVDYFHSIKTNNYDPIPVEQGIASYLKSIGVDTVDSDQHIETVADRELMRFRLMPEKTFVAFFETTESEIVLTTFWKKRKAYHICMRSMESKPLNPYIWIK